MRQTTESCPAQQCIPGLIERARQAEKTAMELEAEGHEVYAINLARSMMPTLQIKASDKCLDLIRAELATYYKRNPAERWGQFIRNGCRVIWVERLN